MGINQIIIVVAIAFILTVFLLIGEAVEHEKTKAKRKPTQTADDTAWDGFIKLADDFEYVEGFCGQVPAYSEHFVLKDRYSDNIRYIAEIDKGSWLCSIFTRVDGVGTCVLSGYENKEKSYKLKDLLMDKLTTRL